MTRQISIRVPDDVMARLQSLADQTGRSKTFYVREAVLEYLEDMEDYFLATSRLQEDEETWSMEEVLAEAGLANADKK
ncbi:MAG: CopG family transcriptional regulator [Gammaproteobacteria bacterium]|nr:MAG: CopG family transcriptional regulator [Gammaproteobacteria bacterium]